MNGKPYGARAAYSILSIPQLYEIGKYNQQGLERRCSLGTLEASFRLRNADEWQLKLKY